MRKTGAFEEAGIKIKSLEAVSLTDDILEDAHFVTIGMLCKEFEGEPMVMEPDEITEWRWFSLDQLPNPVFFPCKKIIKNYLEKKIYKN